MCEAKVEAKVKARFRAEVELNQGDTENL